MTQSSRQSMTETAASVAIGYLVAVASQVVIFPMFGVHLPLADNLAIGLWFTIVSVARGYAVRRFFNRLNQRP